MKQKHWIFIIYFVVFVLSLTACSPNPQLSIEEHPIRAMDWEGERLIFEPLEGTMETILAKHAEGRAQSAITFMPPVIVGNDSINAVERFTGSQVAVDITRNDLPMMTVDAGVISPINNLRGLWVVDDQWFLEIAHVEEDVTDPNATFIIWGEIFQGGESLNEQLGYEEAFNFQILDDKPFFFFSKDGVLGYSYDGRETTLGYSEIPHYLCCSASAFNPQAAEEMVAFYALKAELYFYVEMGSFE